MPTYNFPAKNAAGLLAVRDVLREHGVDFLPLPETAIGESRPERELEVPSLENVALRIFGARRKKKPSDISVMYVDENGRLNYFTADAHELEIEAAKRGILMRLEPINVDVIFPAMTEPMNDALILPSIIAGTPIDVRRLREIVGQLPTHFCFDERIPLEFTRNPHVGNNVELIGLTAAEYIKIAYAWETVRKFSHKARGISYAGKRPPIYVKIENKIFSSANVVKKRDPWKGERLDASNAPFDAPDPAAYKVLTKINAPKLERVPGNKNTKTFDFVRITMGIKTKTNMPNRSDYIRKYRRDIVKIALTRILQHKNFQNKNVPIQFLRVSEMTITGVDELEILFELRKI